MFEIGDTDVTMIEFDKRNEHEQSIISCQTFGNYLVTVGIDQLVKIWDTQSGKQLLKEIYFESPVSSAAFVESNLNLIVCHSNFVSKISKNKLLTGL